MSCIAVLCCAVLVCVCVCAVLCCAFVCVCVCVCLSSCFDTPLPLLRVCSAKDLAAAQCAAGDDATAASDLTVAKQKLEAAVLAKQTLRTQLDDAEEQLAAAERTARREKKKATQVNEQWHQCGWWLALATA